MGYRHTRANGVPIRALFVDIINKNNSLGNPVLYKMFRNTSQQWAANPFLSNRTYFLQGFGVNNIACIISDLYFLVQNYQSLYQIYRIFSNLIRTQFLAISYTEKKLVCNSHPHLSFNHPLPTGRLIE